MTTPTVTLPILTVLDALAQDVAKEHGIEGRISLVLGATGITRAGQKHGHFGAKAWEDDEGNDIHEIFLSGESLKRGAVPTIGTLIHELAHAHNHENGVKGTSDSGRWHNQKFKAVAEEFGLDIEKAPRIGFSVTTVPVSTVEKYQTHVDALEGALKAWRRGPTDMFEVLGEPEKKKAKTYKMQCDECEDAVPIGKGWFLRNEETLRCSMHRAPYTLFSEGGEDDD